MDWLKSIFVTLPKKAKAENCDDYRIISLMSHVLKIFLRIIHARIYRKCESQMGSTQFGFRGGVGTREALFSINVLLQRCRDMNVDVHACFIDYRKAFDTVRHGKMVEILKKIGIDKRDVRIIVELYWSQTAEVRVENKLSESAEIERGVRQGCILSPLLFNIYAEEVFREAINEQKGGININGLVINNLRYADDTVILASNQSELQTLLDAVVTHSEEMGLSLNVAKTKMMVISKKHVDSVLKVHDASIEQVANFRYLGTVLNETCDGRREIRARIEQARNTFLNMKNLFRRSELNLGLRLRMLRCYVVSVLTYGCESWTMGPDMEKRIEALEMYCYRRMMRVSWTQKVSNEKILEKMNKSLEILSTIKRRKLQYLGHIMRGEKYELLRVIIEGRIAGRRSVGRRQNSWLKDLRRWLGCSSLDIFRGAVSRIRTAMWMANL